MNLTTYSKGMLPNSGHTATFPYTKSVGGFRMSIISLSEIRLGGLKEILLNK